jgi:hypothetical protein
MGMADEGTRGIYTRNYAHKKFFRAEEVCLFAGHEGVVF